MKYREQLLQLIFDEDDTAMIRWIEQQPLLDQPEIFRELKELAEELGGEDPEAQSLLADLDTEVNRYEESILDEKLAEAQLKMALEAQEKAAQEIEEATKGVRAYLIECIVTEAPNAKEMKELADKIIALEKENGTFDPENWKQIL